MKDKNQADFKTRWRICCPNNYEYPPPAVCTCLPFDLYPWLILFFLCWITFGSYWVFDTPGAIQTQITAWFGGDEKYSAIDNLSLYSIYSYPNIVLAFFGGYIIDKLTGVRLGTFIFCGLILLGQATFAIGMHFRAYWLCLLGRFIFGLGGESLTVGQNTYTAKWFDGKILAFAFGIVVAFSRVGSSINFLATPILANVGVPTSVWFGTAMCFVSFVACIYVALLDWYGEARVKSKEINSGGEEISFRSVLKFPAEAWLIFVVTMTFYVSVLTFYTVASDIMQHTGRQYSANDATFFLFIPNLVAIGAAPTFGLIIDKLGRSLIWLMIACIMQVIAHLVFLFIAEEVLTIDPTYLMLWIGVGYSMFAAAIWPLLPFVIPENVLATGYGCMVAIQNAGLAIFPQAIGFIQEADGIKGTPWQYTIPILIFVACAGISFLLILLLITIDRTKHGGVLNARGHIKQAYKDKLNSPETFSEPLIQDRF